MRSAASGAFGRPALRLCICDLLLQLCAIDSATDNECVFGRPAEPDALINRILLGDSARFDVLGVDGHVAAVVDAHEVLGADADVARIHDAALDHVGRSVGRGRAIVVVELRDLELLWANAGTDTGSDAVIAVPGGGVDLLAVVELDF